MLYILYQSSEYIKELVLNWMDFNARQYDPQIGRFLGVDPLAVRGGQDMFSPYAAMGNAPESMVDPNGMQYRSPNGYQNVKEIGGDAARRKSPFQDIFGGGGAFGLGGPNATQRVGEAGSSKASNAAFWRETEYQLGRITGEVPLYNQGDGTFSNFKPRSGEKDGDGAFDRTSELAGGIELPEVEITKPYLLIIIESYRGFNETPDQNSIENERSGIDNVNLVVGAMSFAQGGQELAIGLEQSLGSLKYTKALKVVGRGLYVAQVSIAGYNTYNAWSNSDGNWKTNDGNKWGVTGKAALDVTMGAVAVWGGLSDG